MKNYWKMSDFSLFAVPYVDSVFAWTKLETLYLPESLTSIESSFLTCVDSDKLTIYVKKGSYADEHFADFADKSNVEKAYY